MAQYRTSIRYGLMLITENFVCDGPNYPLGSAVIVRSSRGVDWGEIASKPVAVERELRGLGEVMRPARPEDLAVIKHIRESKEPEEFRAGQEAIRARQLPMRLVGVEHLFSGDKIIFYFLADGRVDFRELVKDLARRYRTRIEMRQIGVRDEARLLADYEHCGRELCCRTFIRHLEPVTMRMAKTQKTTLDPTKISGHCGRLMCCLRFEDAVYTQMQAELPPRGAIAVTPRMSGEVLSQDILRQEVTLLLGDGTREAVHLSEITEVRQRPRGGAPAGDRSVSRGSGRRERRGPEGERERGGRPAGGGEKDRRPSAPTSVPSTPPAPPASAPDAGGNATSASAGGRNGVSAPGTGSGAAEPAAEGSSGG